MGRIPTRSIIAGLVEIMEIRGLGRVKDVPAIEFQIQDAEGAVMPVTSFAYEVPIFYLELGRLLPAHYFNPELMGLIARTIVYCQDCEGVDPMAVADIVLSKRSEIEWQCTECDLRGLAVLLLYAELPEQSRRFAALFHEFNARYFSGHLPPYQVRVVFDVHRVSGAPYCDMNSRRVFRYGSGGCIYLRYAEHLFMEQSLIDEMAHVATNDDHGQKWAKEMERLGTAGAPIDNLDLGPYSMPEKEPAATLILKDAGQLSELRFDSKGVH